MVSGTVRCGRRYVPRLVRGSGLNLPVRQAVSLLQKSDRAMSVNLLRVLVVAAGLLPLGAGVASAQFWQGPKDKRGYRDAQYQGPQYRDNQYREDRGREDRRRYDERGGGRGGSYQRTCSDAQQSGSILTAVCGDGRGRQVETSIDVNLCGRSDIANNGGILQCRGVRGRGRRME